MNFLRKIWPTPFNIKPGSIGSFLIQLIIFIIICVVVGFLMSLLSGIAVIGPIFAVIGSLMGIYSTVGIILCILRFFNIVK
ncbi:MAG: hypothetical protein IJL30_09205 [Clostridia bacterium]|nr:hypothetical protein [Clostridia bacterium]